MRRLGQHDDCTDVLTLEGIDPLEGIVERQTGSGELLSMLTPSMVTASPSRGNRPGELGCEAGEPGLRARLLSSPLSHRIRTPLRLAAAWRRVWHRLSSHERSFGTGAGAWEVPASAGRAL